MIPGKIITEHLRLTLPRRDGRTRRSISDQDVAKVAVVARHGVNRNIGRRLRPRALACSRGAIASSVGHDSHNICVVGASDSDMAAAVNRLIALQGGFVVVSDGTVRAELALADRRPDERLNLTSASAMRCIRCAMRPRRLGVTLPEPFLQVAFLPLPVIPHLKITDFGLVDVDRMELVRD